MKFLKAALARPKALAAVVAAVVAVLALAGVDVDQGVVTTLLSAFAGN